MATIKTRFDNNQRRIVTKVVDGKQRVSCSCCVECCLYDSPLEGSLFFDEDLPDEWFYQSSSFLTTKQIEPIPGGYVVYVWDIPVQRQRLIKAGSLWQLQREDALLGWVNGPTANCLNGLGRDNFDDLLNYELTYTNPFGQVFSETGALIRQNVCLWINPESNLFFGGIEYNPELCLFRQFGSSAGLFCVKEPPQKSPLGTYVDTEGLFEGATVVVF
jgi:hypothetical protein